jgi:pyruvate dehydrogenase E2 component (dihydrolipoamide acetyltransferase)
MAKRLAAERNLDLRLIRGTGPGGRIVAADLDGVTPTAAPAAASAPARSAPAVNATLRPGRLTAPSP